MGMRKNVSDDSVSQPVVEPEAGKKAAGDLESAEQPVVAELSLTQIFEALKNRRRREAIRYLREHDRQVTLSDLAEHVAALENDTHVALLSSSQRKRVYVGLYQCHLPKMANMGIVHFDQDRSTVRLGPNAPCLYEYLDNNGADGSKWDMYYIGISSIGVAIFTLTLLLGGQSVHRQTAILGSLCLAIVATFVIQTLKERGTATKLRERRANGTE